MTLRERAEKAGVFLPWIGNTGGAELKLGQARPLAVADLKERHEGWFPRYMGGFPA